MKTVDFLYTNIGRGHPNYLDGIVEAIPPERQGRVTDVFAVTSGASRLAWRLVRSLYVVGGRGGLISGAYNRMREGRDYNRPGLSMRVLGRGLARSFPNEHNLLVVAHPLLVALSKGRSNLVYQHGEAVAPSESWVHGSHRVLVPLSQTADVFIAAGFPTDQLFVSGLCVEPALVARAEHAMQARSDRLTGGLPLCGAFFSSGAEPRSHVELLALSAISANRAGGRVVVFVSRAGRLERRTRILFERAASEALIVDAPESIPEVVPQNLICRYDGRQELNDFTAALFADFDYFVAPAHERSSWALGLGLPMFVVDPPLGSYAPLNRGVLLDAGVAQAISNHTEANDLGDTLKTLHRSGALQQMSENGWKRFDIRGFANIAEVLS